jgi:transposase
VQLTEERPRIVHEERVAHPDRRVREKMLALGLLHGGAAREKAARIVGVSRATVQRSVAAFRTGGLDGLRRCDHHRPRSERAAAREVIRASLEERPARTMAAACDRIFQLTGSRRGPSQVRTSLKEMGLKFRRVRPVPVPPKTTWTSPREPRRLSSTPS